MPGPADVTLRSVSVDTLLRASRRQYDLFVRLPGCTRWEHGIACKNSTIAMACMADVMQRNVGWAVRLLPRSTA